MRSRTSNWFIAKIRYERTNEEGLQKKVTEQYVVDALSFTEAEARIMEEMKQYISGEFTVEALNKAPFKEIFFARDTEDPNVLYEDKWYQARLAFITIDEKTEKEKRSNVNYLVQAGSMDSALKAINEVMGGTMIDYVTCKISETPIMDVYEYLKKKDDGNDSEESHQ